MDRIRNNKALCFLVALFLIIGLMPMTGTAFAAGEPDQVDESLMGEEITRISITADLHLLGNGDQNNRARFETYLKGIQNFEPDLLILCGDQYEGLDMNGKIYTPPEEGDYSSEAGIGVDFTNPYDEIRAITEFYLPGVQIIFTRGNNDHNPGNDFDIYSGFGTTPIDYYGLVKTDYVDIFRFGVADKDSFTFTSQQINALDSYLAGRDDKSKLVLVAGHYPIDDGEGTATNQGTPRNADNSTSVSAILEQYDQPVVLLWSHNHDLGPESAGEILRDYGTGYRTMNSGAVGYKLAEADGYTQGINMALDSNGRLVSFTMVRYDLEGNGTDLFSGGLEIPVAESFPGQGTEDDPFEISEPEHLRYLALMVNNGEDYLGKIFRQTEDIDLTGENWKPIGRYVSSSNPNDIRNRGFSGTYDGFGHVISGLTVDQNLIGSSIINKGYGLFGFLTGTVRNLGMTNINIDAEISGNYNIYAGGIAGYVGYYDTEAGFIENCYVNGTIQAAASLRSCAGGLAGYLRRGEILNSCSSVDANNIPGIDYSGAGGLIGYREVPKDGFIVNGYWDTSMTNLYGVTYGDNVEGLSISGITTDEMTATAFIDLLNQNASTLGVGYVPWMSDQYTNLNNGYPIHERVVQFMTPDIETLPEDTSALNNTAQVTVTITSDTPGAGIWYTTDGTDPTASGSRTVYTTPFALSTTNTSGETITISAVATDGNENFSSIAGKVVKFLALPTNPGGGSGGGGSSGGGSGGGSAVTPITEVKPPLELLPMPDITDITGHWAESGIRKAFGLGFVNGYLDKTFRPERQITRAEFLTMLVKALGMTTPKAISWEDVDQHWAKEQIRIAAQNGIAEGLSNDHFGPDQNITREQMAVMLARAMKLTAATQKSSFRDGKDISAWALNDIDAATQWKLIQGYEDLTFRPQGLATRAEAVEIIIRALNYQENQDQRVTGVQ